MDSCELHHIFPKAQYEKKYNKELINSVFNYTWLLKETNNYIQDKKTNEYLDKIVTDVNLSENQLRDILSCHYINENLYNAMYSEKYIEFIDGRAELFKQLFKNVGVRFKEVAHDELEVEIEEDEEDS